MEKQAPGDFKKSLNALWAKHFGSETVGDSFQVRHLSYAENKEFIYAANLALERSGKIPPIKSVEDLNKPLRGISVCTVGGIEGRVMADMGANVVNIDPDIMDIPKLDLPNLTEIPKLLDKDLSDKFAGQFDMVLCSGLIDRESGFVDNVPDSLFPQHCKEFALLILNLLKKEGIAVLRGDLVKVAIEQIASLINIKEVIPYNKSKSTEGPDVIFIVQKTG